MAGEDEIMKNIIEEEATDAVTEGDDQTPVEDQQVNAPNAATEAERQDHHHEISTTFAANEQEEMEGSSAVDVGISVGISSTVNVGSSSLLEVGVVRKRKISAIDQLIGGSSSAEGGQEGVVARCAVCGREFPSMKALFGHMRTHPDRPWRGVFPPPVFNPEGSPEALQQQEQEQRGINVDLNVPLPFHPPPPLPPPPSPPPPPPPSPKKDDGGAASGRLDLNFPPPPEEE